jgi:hypothetical protein
MAHYLRIVAIVAFSFGKIPSLYMLQIDFPNFLKYIDWIEYKEYYNEFEYRFHKLVNRIVEVKIWAKTR